MPYFDADHLGYIQLKTVQVLRDLDDYFYEMGEINLSSDKEKKECKKYVYDILYRINNLIECKKELESEES